ncbi:hypothetical protein Riv7116_1165 [Rivularia sp. PCC 7116]|nr:hypothetical protein Riv7116_1165 [Rivularia sp. PCC 7116]
MASRKRKKVPNYGRPKRRELGFAQYISNRKQPQNKNHNIV